MGEAPTSQARFPRGRAADICMCLVSVLFFLLLVTGGVLLALYMVLPETKTTMWFPAAGMVLVGAPWAFWIVTCFYRSMAYTVPRGQSPPAKAAPAEGTDRGTGGGAHALGIELEKGVVPGAGGGTSSSLVSHESAMPLALIMT